MYPNCLPIIVPYIDPRQAPSNKSSGFKYEVPSVNHYIRPGSIPKCIHGDISSRAPIIVPGTYQYHETRAVHSFLKNQNSNY